MKKIKFYFNFLIEVVKKYRLIISLSIIAGITLFFVINFFKPKVKKLLPQQRYIGVIGKYNLTSLPPKISGLITYGLTKISPDGTATSSAIIQNWDIADEGKTYTFELKPGILWQDNTSLKSKEIHYEIQGAKIITSSRQIQIKLESPLASLPTILNQPIFKKNKIGLGEYKIIDMKINAGSLSFLSLVNTNKAKDKIIFRFYPTERDLITGFKLGEIDEAWNLSKVDEFQNWKNITIKTEKPTSPRYAALFFNVRQKIVSEKKVRQALTYSFQKPEPKDRAISPIAPNSWAYNKNVKEYLFDPSHGKELIGEAGLNDLKKEIIKIYSLPELLDWAEKIQTDWSKYLGIKTEVHVTNFLPESEQFDVFLGFGNIPADPDQYFFWHSTQSTNLTGINNPKIDQLLETGRQTTDFKEREEIYREFQQTLSEELPAVFLYYPKNYTIIRK